MRPSVAMFRISRAALVCALLTAASCARDRGEPLPRAGDGAVLVCAWHLGGYRLADRTGDGMAHEMKPAAECAATADLLARLRPDLLCVQDLGGGEVLARFIRALEDRGLHYPHLDSVHRGDGGVALFSRFPIVERRSRADHPYTLGGERLEAEQGVVEVDLDVNGRGMTVFVAILRDRTFHPAGQTEMRRNEARMLGNLAQAVRRAQPDRDVLVAVHLADQPGAAAWKEIERAGVEALRLEDSFGEVWTQHDPERDAYLRQDAVFVSPGLAARADPPTGRVIRDAAAAAASPHRPLTVIFRRAESAAPGASAP
jgi:hypothetical protein